MLADDRLQGSARRREFQTGSYGIWGHIACATGTRVSPHGPLRQTVMIIRVHVSRWTLNDSIPIRAMRRETLSFRREVTESILGLMDKASDF
jgi:hypothetical protein